MESASNPLIYLASASPRRSALLDQIGVTHRVQPVEVDETARGGEDPGQYVRRLAVLKAETLWEKLPLRSVSRCSAPTLPSCWMPRFSASRAMRPTACGSSACCRGARITSHRCRTASVDLSGTGECQ